MSSITSQIDRGYTGHEHLQLVNLVNMGGRIYNPVIGRFLTPDPYIQAPENLQNLNRYSYVLNNPLSYTDPSGFFFKKLWQSIKTIATDPKALAIFAISVYTGYWVAGQILTGIFEVGVCVATPSLTALAVSGAAAGFASATTASLLSGQSLSESLRGGLRAGAIAAATVIVTAGASEAFDQIQNEYASQQQGGVLTTQAQNQQIAEVQKHYLKIEDTLSKNPTLTGENSNPFANLFGPGIKADVDLSTSYEPLNKFKQYALANDTLHTMTDPVAKVLEKESLFAESSIRFKFYNSIAKTTGFLNYGAFAYEHGADILNLNYKAFQNYEAFTDVLGVLPVVDAFAVGSNIGGLVVRYADYKFNWADWYVEHFR
jgi:RHS repeat-associated protein